MSEKSNDISGNLLTLVAKANAKAVQRRLAVVDQCLHNVALSASLVCPLEVYDAERSELRARPP